MAITIAIKIVDMSETAQNVRPTRPTDKLLGNCLKEVGTRIFLNRFNN